MLDDRKLAVLKAIVTDYVASREPAFVPEIWFFDDSFTARSVDDLKALRDGVVLPTGARSRLALPIERAEQQQTGPVSPTSTSSATATLPLGGMVIISDGADTTGLPATWFTITTAVLGTLALTLGAVINVLLLQLLIAHRRRRAAVAHH